MAGSDYYDHTTYPSQGASGSSSAMRAELDLIETGFGKLPALSAGDGGKIIAENSGGTALEAITTTGTGSGVRATSPTLVTPALGTPTALVGTNITGTAAALSIGGNAATVTTNANLTGHVTSVGNAAVLGSFTHAQLNTAVSDANLAASGTNSDITSLIGITGPINEARGSVAMHATTMDIWAQPNIIDGTGSAVTITAIANAPQAGARRTLYPIAGTVITNGATFAVDGAANYTTSAGDAIEFESVTTSTYKVHIVKKDGTAIVATSSGRVLAQMQVSATGAVATGTTVIPYDDTIPQITEGDQYLSVTITPQNAGSTLEIVAAPNLSPNASVAITEALFQDATAAALAAKTVAANTNIVVNPVLIHHMTAGTTSATTFKLRIGAEVGATITLNGVGGARKMGGVMSSTLTVKEYLP